MMKHKKGDALEILTFERPSDTAKIDFEGLAEKKDSRSNRRDHPFVKDIPRVRAIVA
jgi:hypothetical protein